MKKRRMLAFVLAGVMFLLCGCGGMTTDDAKEYVQATLDSAYKAEFKKYAEVTDTTEKKAKKEYETNLDTIMKEAGFDDTTVTDELKANYRSLFEKMLKAANYKVKTAEEKDDTLVVTVEVRPFTAFTSVSDELDQWVTDTYSDAQTVPTDEELNQAIMQKMYEIMNAKLDAPTYGDKKTKKIHVKKNEDGAYYIPNADLTAIDDAIFPQNQL